MEGVCGKTRTKLAPEDKQRPTTLILSFNLKLLILLPPLDNISCQQTPPSLGEEEEEEEEGDGVRDLLPKTNKPKPVKPSAFEANPKLTSYPNYTHMQKRLFLMKLMNSRK